MFDTLVSRRAFLQGLAAIGASIVLPAVDASDEEFDQAWKKIISVPIEFEVDEFNTISVPWAKFPEKNADIYYDLDADVATNKQLLDVIQSVNNLADHFAYQFEVFADDPGADKLVDSLIDQDLGWEDWVLRGNLPEHKERIEAWLNDGIDWDYAPATVGPVGEAYAYFNRFAWSTQEDLGVVVIEGEHPGSSYFAAELRVSVDEANQRAEQIGIPIRFKLV